MRALPSMLPDLGTLTHDLNCALQKSGHVDGHVSIVSREVNSRTSTWPSEIVTCHVHDGSELRLFCKYGGRAVDDTCGHRGGITYEAEVYRHVLQPLPFSTPRFYGAYTNPLTGITSLALEHIHGARRIGGKSDPEAKQPIGGKSDPGAALRLAAGWIGRFHAANETRLSLAATALLNVYDAAYYLAWARRTSLFSGQLRGEFPWLASLCDRFEDFVPSLLAPPLTLIHGEYTVRNVLVRDEAIYPIDWESVALGAGEVDLAMLIDRWSEEDARRAEGAYQHARWPEGAPASFRHRLDVARVYIQLRWLGDRPERTHDIGRRWRFEHLQRDAERLRAYK
jgi:hypothetical protein